MGGPRCGRYTVINEKCDFIAGDHFAQIWAKSSQDKGRVTLPRRRTGFNAGALIPGSVSTMVSLPETNEERTSKALASSSFQDLLDCDASSDYETDLEEDFPGN